MLADAVFVGYEAHTRASALPLLAPPPAPGTRVASAADAPTAASSERDAPVIE
jgi:hypothetical protein